MVTPSAAPCTPDPAKDAESHLNATTEGSERQQRPGARSACQRPRPAGLPAASARQRPPGRQRPGSPLWKAPAGAGLPAHTAAPRRRRQAQRRLQTLHMRMTCFAASACNPRMGGSLPVRYGPPCRFRTCRTPDAQDRPCGFRPALPARHVRTCRPPGTFWKVGWIAAYWSRWPEVQAATSGARPVAGCVGWPWGCCPGCCRRCWHGVHRLHVGAATAAQGWLCWGSLRA